MTTDYMFTMKCSEDGTFSDGGLHRFGKIEMHPAACVLNYGQGVIEELKTGTCTEDENGSRAHVYACTKPPTVEQFVEAVKLTVLGNRRWVPPPNKGYLLIKPLLIGNGPVLSVKPAPELTFLIFAASMGNNFKILKAQEEAKAGGFSDVLYLGSVHNRYVEQTSVANIFVVKDKIISTPALEGTVLPGVTRKSIIEIAHSQGYPVCVPVLFSHQSAASSAGILEPQVEERPLSIEEMLEAEEVLCTGSAVCLSPIGSIAYLGKRVHYKEPGPGGVFEQLYQALSNIQMGLADDDRGWTVTLK
ncbi:branched-chain-amino-acid aminotransferase 5, chloroplastic-like [Argentina anserina]|uniref:branched-chain-amino-acid aminotransferase 5, chloroplastic-like n=1 Tax=Argentina anserina TaxID=57926 RepID=UPI0021767D2B|nr:branched-chain-amino-acid aminotransferase 5, chloroplastic-like [Potentilla anserina]